MIFMFLPPLFNVFSTSTSYFVSMASKVGKNVLAGLSCVELKGECDPEYSF